MQVLLYKRSISALSQVILFRFSSNTWEAELNNHSLSTLVQSADRYARATSASAGKRLLFVRQLEVCKPVGSRLGSGRTWAHLASLLLLCPYTRRAHMATVWNTDYIINIIHRLRNRLRNAYTHTLAYRWQLTMQSIREKLEHGGVTKSSQCFGKSGILDHPCIWWWSWLAISSLDVPLERNASLGIL